MKLSAYYKSIGADVELKLNYDNFEQYDLVAISKVFIDTEVPGEPENKSLKTIDTVGEFYEQVPLLHKKNVMYGGTGFYYDKSPRLSEEIEHIKPDYHLYDEWATALLDAETDEKKKKSLRKRLTYYFDYSIGFTTRGCIRRCTYCVNKNYTRSILHSPVNEFLDESREYICLLDDNVFACKDWKKPFKELQASGHRFQYKQGCDERLLTNEKCDELFNKSKWVGDYIFAFDRIKDAEIIEKKLQLLRSHTDRIPKFYVFCGYNHDHPGEYSQEFWDNDIRDLFERVRILSAYSCLPYIMRFADYDKSPWRGMYITLARWCNQPSFFKKLSFREFCEKHGDESSPVRYMNEFEAARPDISEKYYDVKFKEINNESVSNLPCA